MDHFGPAWGSFPATDRYDPTRLWLACISLALRFGHVPPPDAVDGAPGVGPPALPPRTPNGKAIADGFSSGLRISATPASEESAGEYERV